MCDGFVGNSVLKASEGVAKMIVAFLRQEFSRSLLRKLSALAARPVLNALRERMDPGRYNGASLVGLRGIVIKSHGSADRYAFGQALRRAVTRSKRRRRSIKQGWRRCVRPHRGRARHDIHASSVPAATFPRWSPRGTVEEARHTSVIQERTGTGQRTSRMIAGFQRHRLKRARYALDAAGVAADIELIIVATSTADFILHDTACLLAATLGVKVARPSICRPVQRIACAGDGRR